MNDVTKYNLPAYILTLEGKWDNIVTSDKWINHELVETCKTFYSRTTNKGYLSRDGSFYVVNHFAKLTGVANQDKKEETLKLFEEAWENDRTSVSRARCEKREGKVGKLWQYKIVSIATAHHGEHVRDSPVWNTNKFMCSYEDAEVPKCSPIPACADGYACRKC